VCLSNDQAVRLCATDFNIVGLFLHCIEARILQTFPKIAGRVFYAPAASRVVVFTDHKE
jgi:hypothetical protein